VSEKDKSDPSADTSPDCSEDTGHCLGQFSRFVTGNLLPKRVGDLHEPAPIPGKPGILDSERQFTEFVYMTHVSMYLAGPSHTVLP
jgi:hypothetical protein